MGFLLIPDMILWLTSNVSHQNEKNK